MRVIKRNGELEEIAFDKILNRIKKIGLEANINVNYSSLTMKVIDQLYDKNRRIDGGSLYFSLYTSSRLCNIGWKNTYFKSSKKHEFVIQ